MVGGGRIFNTRGETGPHARLLPRGRDNRSAQHSAAGLDLAAAASDDEAVTHLAAILATERALVRRGVHPATAADAARSAWLAAWERAPGRDDAPGLHWRSLYFAARRLATPGRGGASRATAPLPSAEVDPAGRDPASALVELIDAGNRVEADPLAAVALARAVGASLALLGAACGVSGETVRAWTAGTARPRPEAVARLHEFLRGGPSLQGCPPPPTPATPPTSRRPAAAAS